MIWSVVPEQLLFVGQEPEQALTIINYLGRQVAVRGQQVDTLLSSDPNDYLDPRFNPGAELLEVRD